MKIPADAVIAKEKITHYLLVPRVKDDKSKFLAQAGFSQANPEALEAAIRRLIAIESATEDGESEYGTSYRVEGELANLDQAYTGGRTLLVVTIWLFVRADNSYRFVTLKPKR